EAWQEKTHAEEDLARHKLNRKIKAEARWAVEGISARRKRNQGRVRALQALRAERAEQIDRKGTAQLALDGGLASGKRVIEADSISKSYGEKLIFKDVSMRVMRGDRIAFVGPNGVGKTTLVDVLTKQIPPDTGTVTFGTNVELAVFDQARAQLDPDATLWETLTQAPQTRVSGAADQVMVRGTPRHVVSYLQDFLFDDTQARAPVRSLSGGEKARLLLAQLMALPSNLLLLDEPTNDLDIETLDLLQEVIGTYSGTVLLVSHDRDFIDRVATQTVAFEGRGRVTVYAGGWTDYQSQRPEQEKPKSPAQQKPKSEKKATTKPTSNALSFTERHRLEALPDEIARIEAEIAKLSDFLSNADVYTADPKKAEKATEMLSERQSKLQTLETEWLELEERASSE
ncbi:MAG: ATP-binding cassette domain-containing protein, partial [Rhodobacteraceae bacterium]|nr:ATP-binding cassette domain-containing protein [Paracoccaceae bacterium]